MENEKKIEQIHELCEKFDFDSLSEAEKQTVLSVMTADDYMAQRRIILASISLFADANLHQPKPLVIEKEAHFLTKPIPLYKALVGIAAMALLMLLIIPFNQNGIAKPTIKYVTLHDTIETKVIQVDTIEKVIEKPILKQKLVYVNNNQWSNYKEAPRLLEVPRQNQDLSFSVKTIQNKGTSMKDDTLFFDLPIVY